ncbi:putative sulfotransferase domain-containing protein [Skeletonema marinoi]|uniref:Sulfotransferase domain-containing protein n=1 Tax=Skeletonema marinoi TaxID=267567 RepID=A0AAD8XYR9_9STRA|nr:putative sulfotransferase domain-containing protein [Skeletonema marinoi]
MIVTSTNNRQRRNDGGGFSTTAVLKLILSAAAVGAFMNLWAFQSYYSEDDIHLTHHDVDDDVVRPSDNGWRADEIEIREEWERPTDDGWVEDESAVQEEWEPILENNSPSSVDEEDTDDVNTAADDNATEDDKAKTDKTDDKDTEQLSPFYSSKSCFKARSNTVPEHLYGKLQKPYFNLGFPKMGTSSLHKFFQCGGLDSVHYRCTRLDSCARCMRESVEAGGLPLDYCELPPRKIDMYAQMDDGHYFPQIELLDELVDGYPKATLFLTFRSMEKWYNSLRKWPPRRNGPHMNDKLKQHNITGFPSGVGNNVDEFADWYCNHVDRVRDIAASNPSLTLVEVDIEDSTIAKRMSDMFDIDESCWGHTNVNPIANPDLDLSEVQVSQKYNQIVNKKASD